MEPSRGDWRGQTAFEKIRKRHHSPHIDQGSWLKVDIAWRCCCWWVTVFRMGGQVGSRARALLVEFRSRVKCLGGNRFNGGTTPTSGFYQVYCVSHCSAHRCSSRNILLAALPRQTPINTIHNSNNYISRVAKLLVPAPLAGPCCWMNGLGWFQSLFTHCASSLFVGLDGALPMQTRNCLRLRGWGDAKLPVLHVLQHGAEIGKR
jgi:hypothetical protein